ncbi:MAG: asparagine synthase (glutamine-hydrolyzing) [Candidatus Nanoarchaeia archaeon]|jgi:asparagine synthase (glutamine-hydrolysing)
MCGINGFNFSNNKIINNMNLSLKHRGPNGKGIYVDKNVSLGQVRLSILDLSNAGKQPMNYKHKNIELEIVFNGEIYNYVEIKDELLKKGYLFKSNSDTEVITAAYIEYGEECVKKFNGMWAFVIYDKNKKLLFCSRDRFGVKPFYYYFKDKKFIFSSELKGILEHKQCNINRFENINKKALDLYFTLGFIPSPYTIYNSVFKLSQGNNLIFDIKKNNIVIKKFYDLPKYKPIKNKNQLLNEGKSLLENAVKIRMRSDVPIGAFLSGGLDSSSVVGLMRNFTELKKLNTFSIGFENEFDETKYINIVKNFYKTKHHNYSFKNNDFEKWIDKFTFHFDEPFADYSLFPTFQVSELAKKKVTVVLSGDGGDEIFGGYNIYKAPLIINLLKIIPINLRKKLEKIINIKKIKNMIQKSIEKKEDFYSNKFDNENYMYWTSKNLRYCLKKADNNLVEALRIYDILFNTLGDNYCTKVDRASMAYAIEVRSPFLDYRLIEYSQKIPSRLKVNFNQTKIFMRELVKDIVPKEIINLKKHGFGAPISYWFKNLKFDSKSEKELKSIKKISKYWYTFFKNTENNEELNIRLFFFNKWGKKWIKKYF